jgi:hypothetical protein
MSAPRYRWKHQKLREALLPRAYGQRCIHCGYVMLQGQALDLDHTADGTTYRGIVHARCNRAEGARRGNALRGLRRRSVIFPRRQGG